MNISGICSSERQICCQPLYKDSSYPICPSVLLFSTSLSFTFKIPPSLLILLHRFYPIFSSPLCSTHHDRSSETSHTSERPLRASAMSILPLRFSSPPFVLVRRTAAELDQAQPSPFFALRTVPKRGLPNDIIALRRMRHRRSMEVLMAETLTNES